MLRMKWLISIVKGYIIEYIKSKSIKLFGLLNKLPFVVELTSLEKRKDFENARGIKIADKHIFLNTDLVELGEKGYNKTGMVIPWDKFDYL